MYGLDRCRCELEGLVRTEERSLAVSTYVKEIVEPDIGAVRYVLNTLFNIKYYITSREYVRAAPILQHPYLYQGSFEYPSYKGHFRRYDVTVEQGSKAAEWDTADGRIKSPKTGNADFDARQVFTAKYESGTWSRTNFDIFNINELRIDLDLTPANGDDNAGLSISTVWLRTTFGISSNRTSTRTCN